MNTNKGFSLMELLVVIAIIGILSTIVISSVAYARTKARNTYISSAILEYVTAFSMYFSTNGSYPSPSDYVNPTKCLGHRTSECGMVTYNAGVMDPASIFGEQNAQLDSEMDTVFPAAPPFENVLQSSSGATEVYFQGPTYVCALDILGRCMSATITWYLFGNDQVCVRSGTAVNDGLATHCTLTLN